MLCINIRKPPVLFCQSIWHFEKNTAGLNFNVFLTRINLPAIGTKKVGRETCVWEAARQILDFGKLRYVIEDTGKIALFCYVI